MRPTAGGLAAQHGLLRWREWASLGISSSEAGYALRRLARGIYGSRGVQVSSALIASKRVPRATLCLLSAAHFHGLLAEPAEVWLALGRKDWRPRVRSPVIRTVRFSGPALTEGIELHCQWGVPVRVYSVAKTVTDLFRYRPKVGFQPAVSVMRNAIWQGCCTVEELRTMAIRCGAGGVMAPYLEAAKRLSVLPVGRRPARISGCGCHRRTSTGRLVPYSMERELDAIYGGMSDKEAVEPLSPERQALSDRLNRPEEAEEPEPERPRVLRLEATP